MTKEEKIECLKILIKGLARARSDAALGLRIAYDFAIIENKMVGMTELEMRKFLGLYYEGREKDYDAGIYPEIEQFDHYRIYENGEEKEANFSQVMDGSSIRVNLVDGKVYRVGLGAGRLRYMREKVPKELLPPDQPAG
jgi:hypothetical protein